MGKKKKSKGSKLLKMSDEQKARYLLHKAEQEEEAKRRREQLVKTWMMKKLKREQAFARLNLPKIHTFWHQFLRTRKVKEMKQDVIYLQDWLDFILTLKNRIINNLMEELAEAEAQYSYNFKAHSIHIDNLTEFHNMWVSDLQTLFQDDRDEMIRLNIKHLEEYTMKSEDNYDYLKTIVYSQNKTGTAAIREEYEYYMKRNYEIMKNNEEAHRLMTANREAACAALWRRIAHSVRQYVRRTDARRHHMAELRKMDAESATEIADNQERINKLEDLIKQLKQQCHIKTENNEAHLKQLKTEEKNSTLEIIKKRKELMKNIKADNKKITLLAVTSNDCLDSFSKNLRIVEHCQFLFNACRKYETTTENLNKWLQREIGLKYPFVGIPEMRKTSPDIWNIQDDEMTDDFIIHGAKLFTKSRLQELHFKSQKGIDTKKIISRIFPFNKMTSKRSSAPSKLQGRRSAKVRPETAVSKKSKVSSASHEFASSSTPDQPGPSTLSKVVILAKPQPSTSTSGSSSISERIIEEIDEEEEEQGLPEVGIDIGHFGKLEKFWNFHNKVLVDIKELKGERRHLKYENEKLKALLRFVLETAALQGGGVEFETESTVSSSLRSTVSATLKSIYG